MKTIHILGNGAMGCLWASYFAHSHHIIFIKPNPHSSEFTFTKQPDDTHIRGQLCAPYELQSPIDVLIVACKAFSASNAVESVSQYLTKQSVVVLLQNGMGSQQEIAQRYPHIPIYACSSTEGAYKTDASTLIHAGKGINRVGAITDCADKSTLVAALPANKFQWFDDINTVLMQKLIVNCAINPLTVLYQCKNGGLLDDKQALQHMQRVCTELDQMTQALDLCIPTAFSLATDVCQTTRENFSSMYQDWQNNKQTEIEFITGYMVKTCQSLGINCPENLHIVTAIKRLNLGEPI